jgi:hypothetical protein
MFCLNNRWCNTTIQSFSVCVLWCLLICTYTESRQTITERYLANKSIYTSSTHYTILSPQHESQWLNIQNVHRIINSAAFIFAAAKLHQEYLRLFIDPKNSPKEGSLSLFYPHIMQAFQAHVSFLGYSIAIALQTLCYKTIARLLLLCAYGDLRDLAKL